MLPAGWGASGLHGGYAIQLAFTATGGSTNLLGHPTPAHLAALYLPPVLFACGTVLAAVAPRRSRLQPS